MKETIFNCDLKKKMELYAKGDKDAKNLIQNILYFREVLDMSDSYVKRAFIANAA